MNNIDSTTMSVLERHLQTLLITFISASVLFAASYFFTDRGDKAILITNISHLSSRVEEMRADIKTMRAEQASKAHVDDIEVRLRALERASSTNRKFTP